MQTYHDWHIVTYSPWPLFTSWLIFLLPLSFVSFLRGFVGSLFIFYMALFLTIFVISLWFRDIIREASYEGYHTIPVQTNLRYGMALFIFSEVMFFFAFFWSFFWLSFNPSIELNMTWPPADLVNLVFDPFGIPLLNTVVLLSSGATITLVHLYIQKGVLKESQFFMGFTIALAELFICIQSYEYSTAPFDISDGAYASTFYLCTGFHGFHVIIGTIFLAVMGYRIQLSHFSRRHHFGFEAAAWYWHFVDVVWLFLFIVIYCWGSDLTFFDSSNCIENLWEMLNQENTFLNTTDALSNIEDVTSSNSEHSTTLLNNNDVTSKS